MVKIIGLNTGENMYPTTRLRRLRKSAPIRDLVSEYQIESKDLIQPFFVIEGKNKTEPIDTMPGIERLSIDLLVHKVRECVDFGIKAVALFPTITVDQKDEEGSEAYNIDNLVCRAVKAIKEAEIDIAVICDVALDPYTENGHDGIVKDGDVDNDETIEALVAQALTLAKAGTDIIAPSDMMDGRIGAIRDALEESGYKDVVILSYSIKYTTNLYGPFRDAVKSKRAAGKEVHKNTYQADWRRSADEAIREVEEDIMEGADIVMIKPALYYLDVISKVSSNFEVPVFAYQVSGEYSLIKFAAKNNVVENETNTMIEALTAIKRSGASAIFTYAALEVAKFLGDKK